MYRSEVVPKPPRMSVSGLMKDAASLAGKLEGAVPQGAVPIVSMMLSESIVGIMGFPSSVTGVLSRALVPMVENGVDSKRLFRVALSIMANKEIIARGGDLGKVMSEEVGKPHWTVVQITDVISAGYTRAGRHLWGAWGFHVWGPLAGRDFLLKASDAYLCGIVRDVSGAKWSRIVAPIDLSLMRIRIYMEGDGIKRLDSKWTAGKKWNGDIRKAREGCPRGPCEKCRKSRAECHVSPYST